MLTPKQLKLLLFIKERVDSEGFAPSYEEMRDALNLKSKSGIHRLIKSLEERGFIKRNHHKARWIEIIKLPEKFGGAPTYPTAATMASAHPPAEGKLAVELPVMGRIAAGVPIEAINTVSRHIPVPESILGSGGEHFALEVQGDSMIGLGINDRDIVVIRKSKTALDGDIVVALVEDQEATLKRFRNLGNVIRLEAANEQYPPMEYPTDKVTVQGQLVGLFRTY